MVLIKNLNFFTFFYCRLNRPGKRFCRYSRKEKSVLDSKITKLKKSKFWYFSKGVSPWFWFWFSRYSRKAFLNLVHVATV